MQTGMILNGKSLRPGPSGLKSDLVYLGSEFCPNLLPKEAEFGRTLKAVKKRAVLATPFLTDRFFGNIEAIIRKYSGMDGGLEIVANDLGLIHLIGKKYSGKVRLSLGRVLGRALRSSSDSFLAGFLAANKITRFEADSPELAARYGRFPGLACSYHMPYAHVGVTRFCPWERHWVGEKCRYTCLGGSKVLTSRLLPGPLRLINCGYFVNGEKPGKHRSIDRIVFQPSVH